MYIFKQTKQPNIIKCFLLQHVYSNRSHRASSSFHWSHPVTDCFQNPQNEFLPWESRVDHFAETWFRISVDVYRSFSIVAYLPNLTKYHSKPYVWYELPKWYEIFGFFLQLTLYLGRISPNLQLFWKRIVL